MNYFLKRHLRLLTVLVALCLCVSLLAGCQSNKPEETTDSTENLLPSGLVEVKPTETETEPPETTSPIADNMAIVTDQLNVRSSPSTGAKIIGYLDPGTQVEIIKTETYMGVQWALIREGWIVLDYVEMLNGGSTTDPEETQPEETQPEETTGNQTGTTTQGTITANGLYIRKEPNLNGNILGSYAYGDTVTLLEIKDGWGRTDKGWINMTYVKTTGTTTNTNTNQNNTTTTNGTTYFITGSELNIRSEASVNGNIVGQYREGDKVVILETSNGWGKTDKGWISMQYAYKTGEVGKNSCKGIVTTDGLNIRTGPGTGYDANGNYKTGDRVEILEQITVGNVTWGCTSKGWISMEYVYVDGTKGEGSGTGTVTGDQVNIRSGPGTQYPSVGSMNTGDTVEIFAQFTIGGKTWGCTSKGWISMDYVGVG